MDLQSSKKFVFSMLFLFTATVSFSQEPAPDVKSDYKDYKDPDQFYKFHRRSEIINAWQINKLKQGALVVRLKTNKTAIDALKASGNTKQAEEKTAETFVINKNTMMAYLNNYRFSKLYFIYSNDTDSLLKGARSGIFLDTNLAVSKDIVMKEDFYLIAERDYAYNSSIGFIREDSATVTKETGNPVREMGAVIKNKYGHQLKPPFPYYVKDKTFADYPVTYYVLPLKDGSYVWQDGEDLKAREHMVNQYQAAGPAIEVKIRRQYAYKNLVSIVTRLDENLAAYYSVSPMPDESKAGPTIRPYLY